mgnify:CR=1 FL=1
MSDFTPAFERACAHAMIYEVGGWFNANDKETQLGLIQTPQQRKKVGYGNDPADSGGETKFGVAKAANTDLNITELNWAQAKQRYLDKYWTAGGCHLLSPRVAILHFDGCVNHGIGRASKFLQEVVGATPIDGQVGPGTAAKAAKMNDFDVCRLLCDRREKFYRDIVAANPTQAKFLNGWLNRINDIDQQRW